MRNPIPAALIFVSMLSPGPLLAEVYKDRKAPLETRVEDLFGRLTIDEKIKLLGGTGFTTQPISRLGLPGLLMADAGQGVRGGMKEMNGPATAFPAGVTMAATWDPSLIGRVGQAIGVESLNKGIGARMMLGPAVNIHRSPLGGRNGEYMSEDPFLASRLAVSYIQGMQGTGVAACIKHFACNNQESDRFEIDVNVGERALREIYFPAFEAGVKEGKVWTVMGSYNLLNGTHATANPYLLSDVLKKGWGFDGMVVSDWGIHGDHAVNVQAGNDVEMPNASRMSEKKVKAALAGGSITQTAIDDSVHRILRTVIRAGLLDGPLAKPDPSKVNSVAHRRLAYEVATKGIVLLRNQDNLLPLNRKHIRSIAVIGEPAKSLQIGALGSPAVKPLNSTSLLDGLRTTAGSDVKVQYVTAGPGGVPLPVNLLQPAGNTGANKHGYQATYFNNTKLEGKPVLARVEDEVDIIEAGSPAPGVSDDHYSVRWTAKLTAPADGDFTFNFSGDDGFRVLIDGKPVIDQWKLGPPSTHSAKVWLQKGKSYDLQVEYFQEGGDALARLVWQAPSQSSFDGALDVAKAADVAIVCVSTMRKESEGSDRPSMDLPNKQSELIRAVAAVNPRTVVIVNNGTPVSMGDWIEKTPAIIEAYLPGQEGGAALASILFGDVNPSGKLPDTLAANRSDYSDDEGFPGTNHQIDYKEGIYVGYRHFDKKNIAPLFPFGHGLSYTTFGYGKLKLSQPVMHPDSAVTVTLDVTNTGKRAGEEVVQLYMHDTLPKIDRPVRELKGFAKIALKPGETKLVTLKVTPRDLSYFDVLGKQWKADAGRYEMEVGSSSRDIRQKAPLTLDKDFTEPVQLSQDLSKD
ncbi:MAG: glycoside hydrolase family 3 C-terminal domain-containing protein [Luteolibacter sp.]